MKETTTFPYKYSDIVDALNQEFPNLDHTIFELVQLRLKLIELEEHCFDKALYFGSFFDYYDFLGWVPLANCTCFDSLTNCPTQEGSDSSESEQSVKEDPN